MIINPIELKVPWLPDSLRAVTLWPFIFYRGQDYNNPCIVAHEFSHFDDITKWAKRSVGLGILAWYIVYLVFWLQGKLNKKQINEHPMERCAYRAQRYCEEMMGSKNNGN